LRAGTALSQYNTTARYFRASNNYLSGYFDQTILTNVPGGSSSGPGEWVLTDSVGDQTHYWDFSATLPANQRGQFKSYTDRTGNTTYVPTPPEAPGFNPDGTVAEVRRRTGNLIESYLFTYYGTPDPNAGLVQSVTLRRPTDGGLTWPTVVRRTRSGLKSVSL
jgi:hypothetical protein